MTAEIHDFLHPDDYIEPRTGLVAIDIDPKVAARHLRAKTWKVRANFLNDIIVETIECWFEFGRRIIGGRDELERFNAWTWLSVMENVSAILKELGSERPECDDSAAFFTLALNPAHRDAAHRYLLQRNKHPHTAFGTIENEREGLRALYNLSRLKLPGTTWLALNGGVPDDPGFEFREPGAA